MKRSEIKEAIAAGVVQYMRGHRCGYMIAVDKLDRLSRKHADIVEEVKQDAQLARLVRFERRHPKAFQRALTGTVNRAAADSKVSAGALYVENNRLIAFAKSLGITHSRAVRQVERIAQEQGPLAPSKAGRPKRT